MQTGRGGASPMEKLFKYACRGKERWGQADARRLRDGCSSGTKRAFCSGRVEQCTRGAEWNQLLQVLVQVSRLLLFLREKIFFAKHKVLLWYCFIIQGLFATVISYGPTWVFCVDQHYRVLETIEGYCLKESTNVHTTCNLNLDQFFSLLQLFFYVYRHKVMCMW